MKWNQMYNYMADTTIKDMIFVLKTVDFSTYKRTVCIFQIALLNLFRLSSDSIIACKEGWGAYILLWFLYMFAKSDVQNVLISSIFSFYIPCCHVRYYFRYKTTFGSSRPSVVCRRAHVLFTLSVFVLWIVVSNKYCVLFLFVLCNLCWQFLPQLFVGERRSFYLYCVMFFFCFFCVLCTLYCQFLWIVLLWLPLRYSLTFI